MLRPRRKLSRKRGFSSNAHVPSNPQWPSAPRWRVPPTGPWTVPRAPAPSRGTRAALSTARKASRSWGPRASSAPRQGTGTARSPRAQVGSPAGRVGRWVGGSVGLWIHCSDAFPAPAPVPSQPCSLPAPCVTAVTCGAPDPPAHGSVNCSLSPAGELAFGSSCSFACEEGFLLRGPARVECTAQGRWTQPAPLCEGEPGPLRAACGVGVGVG